MKTALVILSLTATMLLIQASPVEQVSELPIELAIDEQVPELPTELPIDEEVPMEIDAPTLRTAPSKCKAYGSSCSISDECCSLRCSSYRHRCVY